MRLSVILCAMALLSCGPKPATVLTPFVPEDLFQPSPGWEGARPQTEEQVIKAAEAEKSGRIKANNQLAAIKKILNTK